LGHPHLQVRGAAKETRKYEVVGEAEELNPQRSLGKD